MFKNKIKTYSFWTGLSAAVVMLCNAIAKCFGFSIDDKLIEDVIMSICGVLVALGFVCMPIKAEDKKSLTKEETLQKEQVEKTEDIKNEEVKTTEDIKQQNTEKIEDNKENKN